MSFKSSFTIPVVAAIGLCLIGPTSITPAYADLGDQLFKLLAKDGGAGDFFGISVAIRGANAIIGARYDDACSSLDPNCNSGSAYLFDTTTGRQTAKLLADDAAEGDWFGASVALSDAPEKEIALVGARRDDNENGDRAGSAYLFDTITGQQISKFLADDGAAQDLFGASVAISGTTAIVGAQSDDDNGVNSGSAYLFDISDPQNPVQIAKLLPNDGASHDRFGRNVAISGATAIVGADLDDDNGPNSGSAYLFDTTTGRQLFKLLPADGAAGDIFGSSVAISGAPGNETAILGAYVDDDNGEDSGSVYLFDATTCLGDLNDDGSVGASDLLILLAFWGRCTPVCLGDLDGDGNVGASDLLALLANWGPCP